MRGKIHRSEWLFVLLQGAVILFLVFHDWVPLGILNDVEGVKAVNSTSELLLATILNSLPVAVALVLTGLSLGKKYHWFTKAYLIINYAFILSGAILAWWIPYFFGTSPEQVERYQAMFGSTHSFLPLRDGMMVNTIHVLFHSCLILILLLSIYLAFKMKASPHTNEQNISTAK